MSSLNPFAVLRRHPNFKNFWLGQTVSQVGTWMSGMAQGWLALVLSNDPLMVGLVAAAPAVPIILFSLPAGVIVDRSDKLRLVKICQALMMLDAAAMWYLAWSRHVTIWWLLGLSFVFGTVSAVEIPARQAMQLDLVNKEDLRAAIALNSSGFNLARIAGPSIAALVIAHVGLAWCFALNATSFGAVLLGLSRIRLQAAVPAMRAASHWAGLREGIDYLRGHPLIAGLMGLVAVYAIRGGAYIPLMPVIAREQLGGGASRYGLLLSAIGVGGLTGALFLAGIGARFPRGRLLRWSSLAFPVALLALSMLRRANFAYPVLFGAGVFMILNGAGSNAILQQAVDDRMRGRLMALYALLVVGLSNALGAPFAGWVARHVGVNWAIAGMSAVMLGYSVWAFRRWPEMRAV